MGEKKPYRVVQIEGKISWRIEELWEGGEMRSPYGSKESAIAHAQQLAEERGYADDLVLEGTIESKVSHKDAFQKDEAGNWLCTQGCSIEMDNKEIVFTEGMKFTPGTAHMGVDVVKWLEEN